MDNIKNIFTLWVKLFSAISTLATLSLQIKYSKIVKLGSEVLLLLTNPPSAYNVIYFVCLLLYILNHSKHTCANCRFYFSFFDINNNKIGSKDKTSCTTTTCNGNIVICKYSLYTNLSEFWGSQIILISSGLNLFKKALW